MNYLFLQNLVAVNNHLLTFQLTTTIVIIQAEEAAVVVFAVAVVVVEGVEVIISVEEAGGMVIMTPKMETDLGMIEAVLPLEVTGIYIYILFYNWCL